MLGFQSTKMLLIKVIHLIGVKKSLLLKKCCSLDLCNCNLGGKEIVGSFYEKELQKN